MEAGVQSRDRKGAGAVKTWSTTRLLTGAAPFAVPCLLTKRVHATG